MKKFAVIFVVMLMAGAMCLSLSACGRNTNITVDTCWAKNETLSYNVYDSISSLKIGTLKIDLKASLAENENVLPFGGEDRTYSSASVRIGETLQVNGKKIETTVLAHEYTVLATQKKVTDLYPDDGDDSYTLQSYHDGKNYVYSIVYADGSKKDGKINVGKSNYTDNEFLYYYIRCYKVDSLPSKTKVADPFTDSAIEVSCSSGGTVSVRTDCTDTKIGGAVECNKVVISRTSSPVGSGIEVYYVTDTDEHAVGVSFKNSRKFPATIKENNVSYVLSDYEVSVN